MTTATNQIAATPMLAGPARRFQAISRNEIHRYRAEADGQRLRQIDELRTRAEPGERREEEVTERRSVAKGRQSEDGGEPLLMADQPDELGRETEIVVEGRESVVPTPDVQT